jgi:hypothetical protein
MQRWVARKADIIRVVQSNANSSVRFTNNTVESIAITSGGTGYTNAAVLTVFPVLDANTANAAHLAYIPDYANGVANVVTNGSGTITGIAITNAGYGLTSNVSFSISGAGSGATLTITTGCTIRGAESNATLGDCVVTSMPVHRTYPNLRVVTNQHQDIKYFQHLGFHFYPTLEHIIVQANSAFNTQVYPFRNTHVHNVKDNDGRILILPSHSHLQKYAANVTIVHADGTTQATKVKSASIIEIPVVSNNSFTLPTVSHGQVYNYSYVINNDLTGETKGHGAAMCRHISDKVTFAENRNAEDLVVYCDVYKPAGTAVTAYARIHCRNDLESFDDKDWTLLNVTSNNATYVSSLTDENDIVELTFGLPSSPASVNTIAGYATCTAAQSNVVGIGTAWSTDLKVNDVVKIYSELFPDDYMISVVRSIANNTQVTLDDTVSDPGLTASNCKVDLLGRPNDGTNPEIGNPFQAFVYSPNSYVVRYYDSALSKKDTYNTFQIKLVLTSNNDAIVPKVWNTRAVGVSA